MTLNQLILAMVAPIMGWTFAVVLRWFIPQQTSWERVPVGLIWIGIAGILLWLRIKDPMATNAISGLAIVGFIGRWAWERVLVAHRRINFVQITGH